MSSELVGVVGFFFMLLLMFLGMPVAISMIVVGLVGGAILSGIEPTSVMAGVRVASTLRDYTVAVLPVFLLMGEFADISGMMRDAYRWANTWLGNFPGGLAMASVLGAAVFSAVSGSSMACAAIMARVSLPQLLERKYDPALATGALAAGGTLGNLIPPGVLLIFYAVLTEVSLGKLFIACLVPGVVLTLMYLIQIYIQCKLKPSLGPRAGVTSWKEKIRDSKYVVGVAIVFIMVMGGIYLGVFTPNEGASIGTVIVFLYALVRRTLKGQDLFQAFKNTVINTGMIAALLIGANMFNIFAAVSQLPQTLATWLMGLNLSALGIVILIMVIYSILGIPMSALTMLLLTLPILVPVLNAYNVDLLWFGVLAIIQMELANLSPPIGMNLFIVAGIAKPMGISMGTVFKGSLPFCVTMLVFNILLIAVPQIALFLPSMMK